LRRRKEEEGEAREGSSQRQGGQESSGGVLLRREPFFFFPFPLERLSRSLIWCFNIKLVVYEKKKVQDVFETSLEEEEG